MENKMTQSKQLNEMTLSELAQHYNSLVPKDKQIKKFADKESAIRRCKALELVHPKLPKDFKLARELPVSTQIPKDALVGNPTGKGAYILMKMEANMPNRTTCFSIDDITKLVDGKQHFVERTIKLLIASKYMFLVKGNPGIPKLYCLTENGIEWVRKNKKIISAAPTPNFSKNEWLVPGPRSDFAGKRIYKAVKENPRKKGTNGFKSFELLQDGMTFEEYKIAGGRNQDLLWDVKHKFVEVK